MEGSMLGEIPATFSVDVQCNAFQNWYSLETGFPATHDSRITHQSTIARVIIHENDWTDVWTV